MVADPARDVVDAAAHEAQRGVEAARGRVLPGARQPEVPLPYVVRRVPRVPHQLTQHPYVFGHPLASLLEAAMRHPAGHERRPARRAPGEGVMPLQCHAMLGQPVHVRRVKVRIVVPNIRPALVVCEPQHHVWLVRKPALRRSQWLLLVSVLLTP